MSLAQRNPICSRWVEGFPSGADAVVAAGAVLTNDAPARKVVLGAPARPVKDVPEEQLLENQGWEDV